MSEREDYLDKLLRDMETGGSGKPESQEEFLENYDNGLSGIDEKDFLSEFEKSLEEDSDFDDGSFDDSEFDDSEFDLDAELEQDTASDDFMSGINDIVSNVKNANMGEADSVGEGDLSFEESFQGLDEEDPTLDQIGNEFAVSDSDFIVNTLDGEPQVQEVPKSNPAQELMDAISAIPEEDLEEEKNISVSDLDSMAQELAKEIEGLNLEEEDKKDKKQKKSKKKETAESEDTQEKEEKNKEKKGFLKRLSIFFFGEEDTESPAGETISELGDLENISQENLEILKEEEKGPSKAEIKAQKAQEKKEKKEQKAKEKAEKKTLKAKEKAEKPKKEKPKEPVEKTKPLPKKPVVLMILLGLSIVVLINLLSGYLGYSASLAEAEGYYSQGKYVEAYGCFSEDNVKKADQDFYNKIRLNAYLQQQISSYRTYQKHQMHTEALGALICGIGRYDRYLEEAKEAGVQKDYDAMYKTLKKALKKEYSMSVKQARKIYALEDKIEFTYAVEAELEKLGFEL